MSTRDSILAGLRQVRHEAPPPAAAPQARCLQGADLVARFMARAVALQSTVERIAQINAAPDAIAAYLRAQGLPPILVTWTCWGTLDWPGHGLQADTRTAHADDLVGVTGCFAAIAETGSLMLCSDADTPATTSLLPETHIALVPVDCIVATMEDAFARLRLQLGQPPRAVNFVSGPSRTGDIEQTMTLGAHGPYRVHLLVVG